MKYGDNRDRPTRKLGLSTQASGRGRGIKVISVGRIHAAPGALMK